MQNTDKVKVTIGMPIYNGEKFLEKRLDSILCQTYSYFELIISDNCSTDNTQKICIEYLKKDKRIQYFRQNNHIDLISNFNYVFDKAKYDYFIWASVDDIWLEKFLESNIMELENNTKLVGSISKVKKYGSNINTFTSSLTDSLWVKKYKKMRRVFRHFETFSLTGDYQDKVKKFLHTPAPLIIYSVFRTSELKKCISKKKMAASDYQIILKVLEFGDVNVVDEILFEYYSDGTSSNGLIKQFRIGFIPLMDVIFPYFNFLNWSLKKFGLKFFMSNYRIFFLMFVGGLISNIREIFNVVISNSDKQIKS